MPPPLPTTQQGSKGGLIAGLVVSIIFALVFAGFYFQERGLRQKAETAATVAEARPVGYLPPLTGEVPEDLKQQKEIVDQLKDGGSEDSKKPAVLVPNVENVFDLVNGEKKALIKLITHAGNPTAKEASDFFNAELKSAHEKLKDGEKKFESANLKADGVNFASPATTVIGQLVDAWINLAGAKVNSDAAIAAEQAKLAKYQADQVPVLKAKDDEILKVQQQLAAKQADLDALQKQYASQIEGVKNANVGNLDDLQKQIAGLQADITRITATIPPLQKKIADYQRILPNFRIDPTENIVRRPDGTITKISEDGKTCFIDLGAGDGIAAGMTFEIYDATKGIPQLKDDIAGYDDESAKRYKAAGEKLRQAAEKGTGGVAGVMAAVKATEKFDMRLPDGGKGSLEVVSVGPGHSSQCRIIKVDTVNGLREGDLIANLVFDRNVKFKFVVFGQFDLKYNGIPTLGDTATVRRLVEQWGGKIHPALTADDITPEVDFIVMGIKPVVPTLSPEDANVATMIQMVDNKKAQLKAYMDVLDRAREYSIPVLNQTRFLYYTGFFDQRNR